jgi:type I restriction enzyme, R subunit
VLTGKAALDAELERLRAEIAAIKKQNAETQDTQNYSEAETRHYFINLLLKGAGWPWTRSKTASIALQACPTRNAL